MSEILWNTRDMNDQPKSKDELKIRIYPDDVLRQECKKVEEFNYDLRMLANNMLDLMYESGGVGLAAPQVGVPIRMFVMDCKYRVEDNTYIVDSEPYIFVNPYFRERHDTLRRTEGCLSFPGVFAEVTRSRVVEMVYQDLEGKEHVFERHEDKDALEIVCVQHEMDHLNGKLFIDHLIRQQRRNIERNMQKLKRSR